ncbi:hypothetical protein OC835_002868 [Tilletia horrida]|nr:hypothetical protein OC835_002868 [Tilletia horrida]
MSTDSTHFRLPSPPTSSNTLLEDGSEVEEYMSASSFDISRVEVIELPASVATSSHHTITAEPEEMEASETLATSESTQDSFHDAVTGTLIQEGEADNIYTPDEEAALTALEDLANPDRARSLTEARRRAQARRQRLSGFGSGTTVDSSLATLPARSNTAPMVTVALSPNTPVPSRGAQFQDDAEPLPTPALIKVAPSLSWSLSSVSDTPLSTPAETRQSAEFRKAGLPIYGHTVPLPACAVSTFGAGLGGGIGKRTASASLERGRFYAQAYAELKAMDSGLHSLWMKQYKGHEQVRLMELSPPSPPPSARTTRGLKFSPRKAVAALDINAANRPLSPSRPTWSARAKSFLDSNARSTVAPLPTPPLEPISDSASSSNTDTVSTPDTTPNISPAFATIELPETGDDDKREEEEEDVETLEADVSATPTRGRYAARSQPALSQQPSREALNPSPSPSSRPSSRASQVRQLISLPLSLSPFKDGGGHGHGQGGGLGMSGIKRLAAPISPRGTISGGGRRVVTGPISSPVSLQPPSPSPGTERSRSAGPSPLASPALCQDLEKESLYSNAADALALHMPTPSPGAEGTGTGTNGMGKRRKMRDFLRGAGRPMTADGSPESPGHGGGFRFAVLGSGAPSPTGTGPNAGASQTGSTGRARGLGLGLGMAAAGATSAGAAPAAGSTGTTPPHSKRMSMFHRPSPSMLQRPAVEEPTTMEPVGHVATPTTPREIDPVELQKAGWAVAI